LSRLSCKTHSGRKLMNDHQLRTVSREITNGGNYQSHGIRSSEGSSDELRRALRSHGRPTVDRFRRKRVRNAGVGTRANIALTCP
jgi:hypothetical protein